MGIRWRGCILGGKRGKSLESTGGSSLFDNYEFKRNLGMYLTSGLSNLDLEESILEVEKRITDALNYDQRLWKEKELSNVKLRVRASKVNKTYRLGDVFQIYLRESELYAYGIVLKKTDSIDLFGSLQSFTKNELSVLELENIIEKKKFCMIADSGSSGIKSREWKRVFHYEDIVLSEEEINKIEYIDVENGGVLRPNQWTYRKIIGDPSSGSWDGEVISETEAKAIQNPYGTSGQGWIEGYLEYLVLGKSVSEYKKRG